MGDFRYLVYFPDTSVLLPSVQIVLHICESVLDVIMYRLDEIYGLGVDGDVREKSKLIHLIFSFNFLGNGLNTGTIHPTYK